MKPSSHAFPAQARVALDNDILQNALARQVRSGFAVKRQAAVAALPEFETLRQEAKEIKDHTLRHLDYYLERFEAKVQENGGKVHWAATPEEATRCVVDICRQAKARRLTKSKSMVGEEIAVNDALEAVGIDVLETDLGEYIIQLAKEAPSHIIAPAIHKTIDQITELFHKHHAKHGLGKPAREIAALVNEARQVLRKGFLSADVGITGANFMIAETGSIVLVTNEGNADLTHTLPRVHIVTTGIEKVVPTLEDATVMLRLLARSATGQEMSSYTTFCTGPKRRQDPDGPDQFHVVLVDNGRSKVLGSEFQSILRCIRCGSCLNHCPVYGAVGGHAYGWVYPGPVGSVLTPLMVGQKEARHLPNACTLNGRCQQACPMSIPLPDLLRQHRVRQWQERVTPPRVRLALAVWAYVACKPKLYQALTRWAMRLLHLGGRNKGRFRKLPFAAGWTQVRDMPAPEGQTFLSAWKQRQKEERS